MASKSSTGQLQLGTRIDGGALELVEVLGVGGYGVVYRAVETRSSNPQSFAVKCLLHDQTLPSVRRQLHIREIALHQISSAHPGIITLHRVIEDNLCTYIIMDYAPDHDLFTQILNNCRYLGNNALIKHVFMQLLDAVEYCHRLGIYHRDLKPENVLCFDEGSRIAITDFGLATTEKISEEMRTGSIYHMSPECQGIDFTGNSTQAYSPMFNDVWSLGIILLNLATGRNPWKTATMDDLTFQAYLRDPLHFFPSVLPVSHEINEVLIRTLNVDWTGRMTLAELRQEIEDIENFYASDVIFDGSQARCVWEVANAAPATAAPVPEPEPAQVPSMLEETKPVPIPAKPLKSHWSEESHQHHTVEIPDWLAEGTQFIHPPGPEVDIDIGDAMMVLEDRPLSQSSSSSYCSYSTSPSTPDSADVSYASCQQAALDELMHRNAKYVEPTACTWETDPNLATGRPHFDQAGTCIYQHPQTSSSFNVSMMHQPHGSSWDIDGSVDVDVFSAHEHDDTSVSSLGHDPDPFALARPATPSPDSYLWAMDPDPIPYSDQTHTRTTAFDPMSLYSQALGPQPQLQPQLQTPREKLKAYRHSVNPGYAPYSSQFLQSAGPTPASGSGPAPAAGAGVGQRQRQSHQWTTKSSDPFHHLASTRERRETKDGAVGRRKVSPFESIKYWLLPGRFLS